MVSFKEEGRTRTVGSNPAPWAPSKQTHFALTEREGCLPSGPNGAPRESWDWKPSMAPTKTHTL